MIDLTPLREDLTHVNGGWVLLVETVPAIASELALSIIRNLSEGGMACLILVTQSSTKQMLTYFPRWGIDPARVVVLDCSGTVTKIPGFPNVQTFKSVSDVGTISAILAVDLAAVPGGKFVFFDSLASILATDPGAGGLRYIHILLTKLRAGLAGGLLFTPEASIDDDSMAEVEQFCDRVIHFK
ncbi:MAG: hypothetical protein ABIC95_00300 [archaeon]